MSTITLCLMVKDEERFLKKCVDSVSSIVDDILILDTGSKDRTVEIIKDYTNNVWEKEFNGDFGSMRNEVLSKVKTDWVLFLDADEFFHEKDVLNIQEILSTVPDTVGGIRFYRYNFFASGGWYSNKVLKLFRNNSSFHYRKKVNESVDDSIITAGYSIIDSDTILNHIGHTRLREERDQKSSKYIQLMEEQLAVNPNDPVLHGYIGLISRTMGDFEFALQKTKDALSINSQSSTLYMFHAHVLRSMNRNEEALAAYEKAWELRKSDAAIINMIGVMHLTMQNYSKAEEYFLLAYKANPTLAHSLINLGLIKFFEGEYNKALSYFNKALDRNPSFLYEDYEGILECDPYKAFYYETIMEYKGLEAYIAICKSKVGEGLSYYI